MIYLGAAGAVIGLLGLLLFRGYHHDHNIGDEIVEQKKIDFVQSVYNTLRSRELVSSNGNLTSSSLPNESASDVRHQRERIPSILPSLNETYTTAFLVADRTTNEGQTMLRESQLRVPTTNGTGRTRTHSGESILSTTLVLEDGQTVLADEFQESRVYATLHALCLHSLVNIFSINQNAKSEQKPIIRCVEFHLFFVYFSSSFDRCLT